MNNEIWNLNADFLEISARDGLQNIYRDDRKNYEKAESEFGEYIKLLDDAIVLFMEALQAAYHQVDKWKGNDSVRAAVAMLISTLNYILLSRHGILLGYLPEVQDLLRSCYERTTRCYLFFYNDKFARKFLEGKRIHQTTVDKELSKIEKDVSKRDDLFKNLRKYYDILSRVAHPNLESFQTRYGEKDLDKRVGLGILFGGLMGSGFGYIAIIRVVQTVLSALKIIRVIIPEESGNWDKEYQRISDISNEMVNNLSIED